MNLRKSVESFTALINATLINTAFFLQEGNHRCEGVVLRNAVQHSSFSSLSNQSC